jgi:uncharacterized repeat protein (TIGR03803 family)
MRTISRSKFMKTPLRILTAITPLRTQIKLLAVALLAVATTDLCAQTLTVLKDTGGPWPMGHIVVSGNKLYGVTNNGGTNNTGSVYSINTDDTGYKELYDFSPGSTSFYTNWDGTNPKGGLALSGDTLYGTTWAGGLDSAGTLFSINTNGASFNVVHYFGPNHGPGQNPSADLLLSGGKLYGTTLDDLGGTVFSVNTDGSNFTTLHWFVQGTNGYYSDGANPYAGLVLSGETLYGTTQYGGSSPGCPACGDNGTVFSVNTNGFFISGTNMFFGVLHRFSAMVNGTNSDGAYPVCTLVLSGNTLYGVAQAGGPAGCGTIFSVNTDGTGFTVLYSFSARDQNGRNSDGAGPMLGLVLIDDTLFGNCTDGGLHTGGTVFSIKTNGTDFTVLYQLPGNFSDNGVHISGLTLSGCTFYGAGGETLYSLADGPVISGFSLAGQNLILSATNGLANCTYTLLTSTNLSLPRNQWSPLGTNSLMQNGGFTFNVTNAIDPAATQGFFIIQAS